MKKVDLFIAVALILICTANMTVSIFQKNWMGFSGWFVAGFYATGVLIRILKQD